MTLPGDDLISHTELLRYRLGVLDGAQGHGVGALLHHRTRIDPSRVGLVPPRRGPAAESATAAHSDPEWTYVSLNRYVVYLQHSIARGTQWAVFEDNAPALWARISSTVADFLLGEWRSGHLSGARPTDAFFVRCDRTTMTQNDLDNGRLVCLVGVAPVQPAQFIVFRVSQGTSSRRRRGGT